MTTLQHSSSFLGLLATTDLAVGNDRDGVVDVTVDGSVAHEIIRLQKRAWTVHIKTEIPL